MVSIDRALRLKHLEQAERHIAEGERHIAEQEQLIIKFDLDNRDATLARQILETLRSTQAMHVAHRDHILGLLKD